MPQNLSKKLQKAQVTVNAILNTGFDFDALNPAQKQAVLQTTGPLLIIAGAGTGKTHVITARILHLLLNEKIPAKQILALTFTEKAAQEMQQRLDLAMPLSYEEIAIKTFHAFAESVLRERGIEIGIDPNFKLLDQTGQWLFMRKNLFSFELDYYRPLGNPTKFFNVLLNHFSRLKDEDISPESYLAWATSMLENAQKSTGDVAVAREEAVKTFEIARAYAMYQKLMAENGLLDFGDLQYYCLRLFEKRASVLNFYQERFQYVLVDEFQDTNFAQNKLVMMLAAKHSNLAVVGDDDQAIYKWRGASLSNILNFEKTFPETKKVVLTDNYRSTRQILDLSYALIQNNNPYRLEFQQQVNKKLLGMKDGAPPQIWHFASLPEEASVIVKKIAAKIGESEGRLSYRDFAILVRTNQLTAPFCQALQDDGIPFAVRNVRGLLHFEAIKDLVALLKFLANPNDDIAFFRLVCLEIFGLKMKEILDLAARARAAGYEPLFKFLRVSLKKKDDQEVLPGLENRDFASLEMVYDFFDRLLEFSKNHEPARILGKFLEGSGYLKNLLDSETFENNEKIRQIGKFSEIIKNFAQSEMQYGAKDLLRAFLEHLELLEESETTLQPLENEENDAVSLLTFHGAKGLEFDTVFMPSLVAQRFPAIHRRDALEIPLELIKEEIPVSDEHLHEERRLFYVGCTRARNELIFSYSDVYEGRKKWKPSLFLGEVKAAGKIDETDFTKKQPGQSIGQSITKKDGHRGHQGLKIEAANELRSESKTPAKDRFLYLPEININQLSYSQLDTFASCPLKYKFRYLFKIPEPSAHAANFGSSIHNTLNQFYQQLKNGAVPSKDLLRELFEKNWIPAGYDSKSHEMARKKQGREILECFYDHESTPHFRIPAYLERLFRLKIGEFTFSGRIDRIDKMPDGSYEVVDYKTGTSKREADLGKDLQLSLYALACRDIFGLRVSKLSLYFLEDTIKHSTTRSDEELNSVKDELLELSRRLVNSDFLPTPGFHCRFCDYRLLCRAAQV